MDLKMKLTDEQLGILNGERGETAAKVMKTLVLFGEVFGAEKLVPVTHAQGHLVTSFGIGLLKPLFRTMDELIAAGLKAEGGLTVDPRPVDYENVKCNLLEKLVFDKFMYSEQARYEEQLMKVGLRDADAFSCTCYLPEAGNVPAKGDVLSWAESSAVVYANSVLGARCNRNSGMLDLFGSVVGYVPYFGLLTDEGRRATWKVVVKTSKLPEAQVLGSAIGMKVVEDVPYVFGLDKFLGGELTDDVQAYLKDFGAATASNGAVGLYHIDGLTPRGERAGRGAHHGGRQDLRHRRRGAREGLSLLSRHVEGSRRKGEAVLHRMPPSHLFAARRVDKSHPWRARGCRQAQSGGADGAVRRSRRRQALQSYAAICRAHRDGRHAHEHMPADVHQQPAHQEQDHRHQQQ